MRWLDTIQLGLARRKLRQKRADFYYDLAAALEDKIPIFTILKGYEARARRRDPSSASMYRAMMKAMQAGGLSVALRPILVSSELIMLDAIQNSGDAALSKGLYFMSEMSGKLDHMNDVMRRAVTYPLMMLCLTITMIVAFSLYAVPLIESLLPLDKWPPAGKALYAVSYAVRHYGFYMLGGVVVCLAVFLKSLATWQSPLRRKLDNFIPYSVYRTYTSAMLIVSISSLMRTGVSLRASLERAMKFSSPWLRWHLREVMRAMSSDSANKFGSAFKTGMLSHDMEDRVQEASERRDPVAAFVKIGIGSIDRIVRSMEDASSSITTALLFIAGGSLGMMIIAFLLTTQSISSGMRTG
jgi:type II secretory pathway component PulF